MSIESTYNNLITSMWYATGAKKNKKKRKKKVTIDSSEKGVANIMTSFFGDRKKQMKKKLDTKKEEKEKVDKQIKDLIRKARTLESTTGTLARKYEEDIKKKRSSVVGDYRKLITKIKLLDFIEKFEVDSEKRILFTTVPIKIKKDTWGRLKIAGRYQVRIDFKKETIGEGIQAINLDKFYKEYDHPNIRHSYFCYGEKLAIDIENEYREQDLYELVIDVVDLLRSPNDKDGFTKWNYFFKGAKKRSKNYSFEKFDAGEKSGGATLESYASSMVPSHDWYASTETSVLGTSLLPASLSRLPMSSSRPVDQNALVLHLFQLGFIDYRTAEHFAERIVTVTRGQIPATVELRRNNSESELFFTSGASLASTLEEGGIDAAMDESEEQVTRIQVSNHLLRPEGSAPPSSEQLRRVERESIQMVRQMDQQINSREPMLARNALMPTVSLSPSISPSASASPSQSLEDTDGINY